MSLVSASITLPSRIGRNITLASLSYLNVVHCLALVIHILSKWLYLKHINNIRDKTAKVKFFLNYFKSCGHEMRRDQITNTQIKLYMVYCFVKN